MLHSHTKCERKGNANPFHSIFRAIEQRMFMGMRYIWQLHILNVGFSMSWNYLLLIACCPNFMAWIHFWLDTHIISQAACLCVTIESIKKYLVAIKIAIILYVEKWTHKQNNGIGEIYLKTAIKMRRFVEHIVKEIQWKFTGNSLASVWIKESATNCRCTKTATKSFEPLEREFFLL